LLDDKRLEIVARNRGLRAKEGASAAKLLTAFLRKAEEGVIGKLIIEAVIQLSVRTQLDGGKVLRAAAQVYEVDPDAIALKVKQEFAVTAKAKEEKKPNPQASLSGSALPNCGEEPAHKGPAPRFT
jgi:ParB family transcriptional regulator, chromosome partitioning protein